MNPDNGLVAFDLETKDPGLKELGPGWATDNGFPVGYAIAWRENGELLSEYLPIRHGAGGNLSEAEAKARIAPILANEDFTVVMANCLYDYGWTLWDEIPWRAKIDDVQILAPLLDDQRRSYSLENLAKDYLPDGGKRSSELRAAAQEWGLKDPWAELWKLPGGVVEDYARGDAETTLRLYEVLQPQMAAADLERVWQLERDLVPVLYAMRKRGVRVDVGKAYRLHEELRTKLTALSDALWKETGMAIEPWNSRAVVKALRAEGVTEFPLTEKKAEPSVDAEFLRQVALSDSTAGRVAGLVLQLRKWQKIRSTFIERMVLGHAVNQRIYGELHALRNDDGGTVSGRFSASKPNLQQVPARDPETGPMIRSLFLPAEGEQWAAIDYSSQEPRLAFHFAALARLPGADSIVDTFRSYPQTDPYEFTASLCGVDRKTAKTIRLGVLYGMGGGKMCEQLGLPTEEGEWKGRKVLYAGPEGKKLLDTYHRNSPLDRELSKLAQRRANEKGEVRTLFRRRATFPRRETGERWFTHKALNRVIQGSAADMTKKAMVDCFKAGETPLLSIHDELCFSVKNPAQARAIAGMMEAAVPLKLPVVCDVEVGPNWGEAK